MIPGASSVASWARYRNPYLHIRAEDVFDRETYGRLTDAFKAILENTRLGHTQPPVFRPPSKTYDAMICAVDSKSAQLFSPMFDLCWLEHLASLAGVGNPRIIDGALHHIPRGSRSGYIHTDFCSAWFDRSNENDPIRFPVRRLTEYFSGTSQKPEAQPVEFVRALTMIYYLANDSWMDGDGGETGIFATASGRGPNVLCPPKNNSLFIFECTPHSYHAMQGNPGRDRNSIILWLHSEVSQAKERWPAGLHRRSQ